MVAVPAHVVLLLAFATQSDTQLFRDTASARAWVSAVVSSLLMDATLLRTMNALRFGAAMAPITTRMAMTTSDSISVNPRADRVELRACWTMVLRGCGCSVDGCGGNPLV